MALLVLIALLVDCCFPPIDRLMNQSPMRLCLVRHGETAWNAQQRMQGHKDLPLSPEGLAQAEQAGRLFVGLKAAAIYSSDLQRAWQTATPIAAALSLPIVRLVALRERNYGRCEGMIRSEVSSHYPEDARALRERRPDYVLPGGESLNQHLQRIRDCIDALAAKHAGETVVVVTHGGVLDLIYRQATGTPIEKPRDFPIPNTGICWLSISADAWHVEQWADTAHLGERGAIEVTANF